MNKRRIFVNSAFLYAQTATTVVISIFSSRFILEGLGIEDYGIYNVVGGVIGLMGFLTATLSNSNSRFIANALGKDVVENSVAVFQSVQYITKKVIFLLTVCLLIIGFIFINYILNIPENRLIAANIAYACILVNTIYTLLIAPYSAILFAREKIAFMAGLEIGSTVLRLGIAYLLTFTNTDNLILYAVLLMCLSYCHRTILRSYCVRNDVVVKKALKTVKNVDKKVNKAILSFSGWNLLDSIGIITIRQGSIMLINLFYGVTVNAAYGIAAVVSLQMRQFAFSLLNAVKPLIYKTFETETKERREFFTFFTSKIGIILLSFVVVPVICEVDYILNLWLVEVPEFTSIFIKLALILTFVSQMSYGLSISMQAYGRIKELQITTFLLQILNLPIGYFIFKYGYPPFYIYIVTIGIEFLILISRLIIVKKILELNINKYILDIVFKPLVMSVISYVFLDLITANTGSSILQVSLVFFSNFIFAATFSYFIILSRYERIIAVDLLSSFKNRLVRK